MKAMDCKHGLVGGCRRMVWCELGCLIYLVLERAYGRGSDPTFFFPSVRPGLASDRLMLGQARSMVKDCCSEDVD